MPQPVVEQRCSDHNPLWTENSISKEQNGRISSMDDRRLFWADAAGYDARSDLRALFLAVLGLATCDGTAND